MPTVGKKKFAYDSEGQKKAYLEAAKTGNPIQNATEDYAVNREMKPNKKINNKRGPYNLKTNLT